ALRTKRAQGPGVRSDTEQGAHSGGNAVGVRAPNKTGPALVDPGNAQTPRTPVVPTDQQLGRTYGVPDNHVGQAKRAARLADDAVTSSRSANRSDCRPQIGRRRVGKAGRSGR